MFAVKKSVSAESFLHWKFMRFWASRGTCLRCIIHGIEMVHSGLLQWFVELFAFSLQIYFRSYNYIASCEKYEKPEMIVESPSAERSQFCIKPHHLIEVIFFSTSRYSKRFFIFGERAVTTNTEVTFQTEKLFRSVIWATLETSSDSYERLSFHIHYFTGVHCSVAVIFGWRWS